MLYRIIPACETEGLWAVVPTGIIIPPVESMWSETLGEDVPMPTLPEKVESPVTERVPTPAFVAEREEAPRVTLDMKPPVIVGLDMAVL